MKLKKVALILGISICLIAGQIQMTFGLEQNKSVSGKSTEHADGQSDEEKENGDQKTDQEILDGDEKNTSDTGKENQEGTGTEVVKPEDNTGEEQKPEEGKPGDNTGEEQKPEEGKPGDNTGEEQKPEEGKPGDTTGEEQKPEEGKPGDTTGEEQKPEEGKPGDTTGEEQKPEEGKPGDNTGEEQKPEEGKPGDTTGEEQKPEEGKPGDNTGEEQKPEEEKPGEDSGEEQKPEEGKPDDNTGGEQKPEDTKPEDGTVQTPPSDNSGSGNDDYEEPYTGGSYDSSAVNSYSASIRFLDDSEKIKYNVSVPIEGLPSFITQEMIVAALKCQDETGYPASVTIAQIIQESGFGQYGPGGEDGKGLSYLAYQYNNLFGIKGTGPAGSVDMVTGEQSKDGSLYIIVSGFRVYDTYTECIEDRTELLKEVYLDLTLGVNDANTFAMKVGSRWATSLTYGQSLIRQMEEYDLYRLDNMTLGQFSNLLGTFVNPCPGAILSSDFGSREEPIAGAGTYHKGIDLGTGTYNIPTYAAASGTVTFAGEAGTAGNLVIIDHGNGLVTKYMHHEKVFVEEGQKVEKGQQIGLSGTTGQSTGNHLHFQVEENGTAVDPFQYFTDKQKDSFYQ